MRDTICTKCKHYPQCPAYPMDTCGRFAEKEEHKREKFTRGPWEYHRYSIVEAKRHNGKGIDTVCRLDIGPGWVNLNQEELAANAALISAAPEMYDMLNALLAGAKELLTSDTVAEMERILKKARGEE